ncbi:hypothetical protein FRB95_005588 [Tulasnella sp. JGI-2019a]|nr:hypothetical protein FRB95_005588 [Tulasnella sp. JGI-2019a]
MAVSDNNLLCDPKSDGTGDGGAGVDQPRSIEHAAAAAAAEARLKTASKTGSLQVGSINSCISARSKTRTYLLLYHILLVIEWLSILSMTTYHLFVGNLSGAYDVESSTGTVFSHIVRWAYREIVQQHPRSPIIRRSHTLYQAIGFSIAVTHTLESIHFINRLLGAWRFRSSGISVKKELIRWMDRAFIVYWILNYPVAQKSSVFAALTLAWSITSVDQQLAFIDKLLPRDTKPLRRVLHFASIVLNPIAAAAECYLIFVTIPQSCVWWPSISISRKAVIAFLMDPQVLYQSRGFRLSVFSWASTGLYTKAGDYFRSAMFFLWIAGWISRLLGPTWIVLSALLCVSVLVHQQYNPGPTIIVL